MSTEEHRRNKHSNARDKIMSLVNLGLVLEALMTGKRKAPRWASQHGKKDRLVP